MILSHWTNPLSVSNRGAVAGSILCGSGLSNRGVRLQVLQEQAQGADGPLQGKFVILDAGDNPYSVSLWALLDRETDAAEVMAVLRQEHAGYVNVVNAGILVLDDRWAATPPPFPATELKSDPRLRTR
jgi:hypothetical protein